MYKLCPINKLTNLQTSIIRLSDLSCIPFDPDNTDYQAYLEWVADGGVPEEADA